MYIRAHGSEIPFKMVYHYYQTYISDGMFRRYDHGEASNIELYGTKESTPYPLENIKVPVYIVHGENDNIDCPTVSRFYQFESSTITMFLGKRKTI